jgi:hypothetical protein
MTKHNKLSAGGEHRGRPEAPLEVEIEFIDHGKASAIWDKFFELLKANSPEPTLCKVNEPNDLEDGQLGLF